ncbi:MAG: hypothetical protein HOQ30_06365, partial [Gemmatimonadaceae bacterium]|nr:hypothetical protein [Gemmatimonadaceae bacterium]
MRRRGRSLMQGVLLAAASVVCLGRAGAGQSTAASFKQLAKASLSQIDGTLRAPGLKDEVE